MQTKKIDHKKKENEMKSHVPFFDNDHLINHSNVLKLNRRILLYNQHSNEHFRINLLGFFISKYTDTFFCITLMRVNITIHSL